MEFPIYELNVDEYKDTLRKALLDENCHIFIDTNIISQLYQLNTEARKEFYNWIEKNKYRFHVPTWVIHEYSNHYYSNKTDDYLSTLKNSKAKIKEIAQIKSVIEGYIDESILKDTVYNGKIDSLKEDTNDAIDKLDKITLALNKNIAKHKIEVHKEISEKLQPYILNYNIFEIIEKLDYKIRYDSNIPPGFKDANKDDNYIGDLVIWKEILQFSQEKVKEISSESTEDKGKNKLKVVFISKDQKLDMVYTPGNQIGANGEGLQDKMRIKIARESLKYEFFLSTNSREYYQINFNLFLQLFINDFKELSKSLQIAEQGFYDNKKKNQKKIEIEPIDTIQIDEECMFATDDDQEKTSIEKEFTEEKLQSIDEIQIYSSHAIIDKDYQYHNQISSINDIIIALKSNNWYEQNPAIEKLKKMECNFEDSLLVRDAFFVLGRNLIQSAEGYAYAAVEYLNSLSEKIYKWKPYLKKAFVDGCLFEVYFNSLGEIRTYKYKAEHFNQLINEIRKLDIKNVFEFINSQLDQVRSQNNNLFLPELGSDKTHIFKFIQSKGSTVELERFIVVEILIDDKKYPQSIAKLEPYFSSSIIDININLSKHFAIPENMIGVKYDVKDMSGYKMIIYSTFEF